MHPASSVCRKSSRRRRPISNGPARLHVPRRRPRRRPSAANFRTWRSTAHFRIGRAAPSGCRRRPPFRPKAGTRLSSGSRPGPISSAAATGIASSRSTPTSTMTARRAARRRAEILAWLAPTARPENRGDDRRFQSEARLAALSALTSSRSAAGRAQMSQSPPIGPEGTFNDFQPLPRTASASTSCWSTRSKWSVMRPRLARRRQSRGVGSLPRRRRCHACDVTSR